MPWNDRRRRTWQVCPKRKLWMRQNFGSDRRCSEIQKLWRRAQCKHTGRVGLAVDVGASLTPHPFGVSTCSREQRQPRIELRQWEGLVRRQLPGCYSLLRNQLDSRLDLRSQESVSGLREGLSQDQKPCLVELRQLLRSERHHRPAPARRTLASRRDPAAIRRRLPRAQWAPAREMHLQYPDCTAAAPGHERR